jgi:hypothetical protein
LHFIDGSVATLEDDEDASSLLLLNKIMYLEIRHLTPPHVIEIFQIYIKTIQRFIQFEQNTLLSLILCNLQQKSNCFYL